MSVEFEKDIVKKLIEASNKIHQSSTKGSGSFIITNMANSLTSIKLTLERIEKCKKILNDIKNK